MKTVVAGVWPKHLRVEQQDEAKRKERDRDQLRLAVYPKLQVSMCWKVVCAIKSEPTLSKYDELEESEGI